MVRFEDSVIEKQSNLEIRKDDRAMSLEYNGSSALKPDVLNQQISLTKDVPQNMYNQDYTMHNSEKVSVYENTNIDSTFENNINKLRMNLASALSIIDNKVLKSYVSSLNELPVVALEEDMEKELPQIQFFHITNLVYQENEFNVHKLSTIFSSLANKPCTLCLLISSNGHVNNFYLGVRPREKNRSTSSLKKILEQGLLAQFPGSKTEPLRDNELMSIFNRTKCGSISSVTCIADYKQEENENNKFIQGLEKFVDSMEGKAYTAIFIANNLDGKDISYIRRDYENIYSMLSPFANMQHNFSVNENNSIARAETKGKTDTETKGEAHSETTTEGKSTTVTTGESTAETQTKTQGESITKGQGITNTEGKSETDSVSVSVTQTKGSSDTSGVNVSALVVGANKSYSTTTSVSRGKTQGKSTTKSVSQSISENLSHGINDSQSIGKTTGSNHSVSIGENESSSKTDTINASKSIGFSFANTDTLTKSFGNSQTVTFNLQNKPLINSLDRLDKQLERIDECEGIGMWDFSAYFVGESTYESESAASIYRSLVSGDKSGLETSAINTWNDDYKYQRNEIYKYLKNFIHPIFLLKTQDDVLNEGTLVDATSLVSTNELSIQMGLPQHSVRGLSVSSHARFPKEIVMINGEMLNNDCLKIGNISNFGANSDAIVDLDLQSLSMHTFVTGSTGSGKSNTIYEIMRQLMNHNVKVMVIEPAKGEYKNVFGNRSDVKVFGSNPYYTELLRLNPFVFPKGIHVLEHIDRLVEIFNVCWPMYAAMPAVLKEAIIETYRNSGWDLESSSNRYSEKIYPGFKDLLIELCNVIEKSEYSEEVKSNYKGSLMTRVKSLTNGLYGNMFSSDEVNNEILFNENVIIDLSRIGSLETKSLIMGIIVMRLNEYRMCTAQTMNNTLQHVTILEEAHNILKRTSTEQNSEAPNLIGKSVEMISNSIAEMRTYGEGFIIVDQSPNAVDISAIRNTGTKIIMRLPEESDRLLVGKSVALKEEQLEEIARLPKGGAIVYQNSWLEPVLCNINKYNGEEECYFKGDSTKKFTQRVSKRRIIEKFINVIRNKEDYSLDSMLEDILTSSVLALNKCRIIESINNGNINDIGEIIEIIADILNCKVDVANAVEKASTLDELDSMLHSILLKEVECDNSEFEVELSKYILMNYFKDKPEQCDAYQLWNQHIYKKGRMVF